MILFLDFDGVLHPEPCYSDSDLFCHRPLFESVMREFPDIEIVISSTWRQNRSLAQLKALFSDDIAACIVGVTPDWRELVGKKSEAVRGYDNIPVRPAVRQIGYEILCSLKA